MNERPRHGYLIWNTNTDEEVRLERRKATEQEARKERTESEIRASMRQRCPMVNIKGDRPEEWA